MPGFLVSVGWESRNTFAKLLSLFQPPVISQGLHNVKTLKHLIDKNRQWADTIRRQQPDFFDRLSRQQNPDYLWIGCSDSRVPANQIVGVAPGEIFVHRNIANTVVHTDLNCLSVIQYAVEVLGIQHIIVCGHYGCGGIRAAMENHEHGLIDNWLLHIKDTQRFHAAELEPLDREQQFKRLCELNVIEQVKNVAHSTIVQTAWKQHKTLHVHGWIYDLANGLIADLGCGVSNRNELLALDGTRG